MSSYVDATGAGPNKKGLNCLSNPRPRLDELHDEATALTLTQKTDVRED